MEQILENLRDGDPVTAGAVVLAAVVLFFILKMMLSVFKALLIMVVIIVALAVFYPEMNVIDKVEEGSKSVIEKSKELGQKAADAVTDPETVDSLKEKAAELAKKAHGE